MIALVSIARKGLEVCKISVSSGSSSQTSISHPRVIVLGTGGSTSSNNLSGSEVESISLSMLAKEVLSYFAMRNGSRDDDFSTAELYVDSNLKVNGLTTTKDVIVDGDISTEGSVSGFSGKGLTITKDSDGTVSGEIDNLTVRKIMRIYELLSERISAIKGSLVLSQADGTVDSISETPTKYMITLQESYSSFAAGDLVRCHSYDGTDTFSYWVEVESVEGNTITILKSEFEGYSTPAIGDELVQMGNSTDTSRQGLVFISTTDDGLPRIEVLAGVDSKDLSGKSRTVLGSLDSIDGCEGYGIWSSNAYLTGQMTIGAGSSGLENLEEWNTISEEIEQINSTIEDVVSDTVITVAEKVTIKVDWDRVLAEYSSYTSEASTNGVDATSYCEAYSTLYDLVTPVLEDMTTSSTLASSSDWISAWSDYGSEVVALAAAIESSKVGDVDIEVGGANIIDSSNGYTRYSQYNSKPTYDTTKWIEFTKYSEKTYITVGTSDWSWKDMEYGQYTMSGYIYIDGEIPTEMPFIRFHTATANLEGSYEFDSNTGYFVITQYQGGYTSSFDYFLHAQMVEAYQGGCTVRFEYLMLEKGNIATSWGYSAGDISYLLDTFKSDSTVISGGSSIGTIMTVKDGDDIKAGLCGDTTIAPFLFAEPQGSDMNMYNDSLFRVMSDGTGAWGILNVDSSQISVDNGDSYTVIMKSDLDVLSTLLSSAASPGMSMSNTFVSSYSYGVYEDEEYSGSFSVSEDGISISIDPSVLSVSISNAVTTSEESITTWAGIYLIGEGVNSEIVRKMLISTSSGISSVTTVENSISLEKGKSYTLRAWSRVVYYTNDYSTASARSYAISNGSYVTFTKANSTIFIAPNGIASIYGTTNYDYTVKQSSGVLYKECRSGNAGIRVNNGTLTLMIAGTWYNISRNSYGYLTTTATT